MARISVRNIDNAVMIAVRLRAAAHGRSVSAEVREILNDAVKTPERGTASKLAALFTGYPYPETAPTPPTAREIIDFSGSEYGTFDESTVEP